MVLTYRYRIKDATCGRHLERQARAVNRVWNYCGEVQNAARRHNKRWPSGFDLIKLTSGTSKLLGLHSDTVQAICKQIEAPRLYRRYERALAIAQRAGRKPRLRAIHAKVTNCRKHFLHELSTRLVRENRRLCVGNVNSSGLARTRLAKSVLDAGWSQLRSQLHYKAMRHGAEYIEVDERLTTQVCSACGARAGPQGREGLVVRDWTCSGCGASHDRDINSAINILVSGRNVGLRQTEIPSVHGGEDVKAARRPATRERHA